MSKEELFGYKWHEDLNARAVNIDCIECSFSTGCIDCAYCTGCTHCVHCFACRNAGGLRYAICNVEVGKEKYEQKIAELFSN